MLRIDKLMSIIIFVLIFFMLFAAADLMTLKIGITTVLICICCIYLIKNRKLIKVSKGVLSWFYIYIGLSIIHIAISTFNNNPGATNFIGVNIINPIIYFILCISVSNSKYFDLIKKYILISGVCIVIYNLIFTVIINIFPEMGYGVFPFIQANEGGINLGFTKFTSENVTILTFLTPFALALFLFSRNKRDRRSLLIIVLLGMLSAVLSARTAYILSLMIAPLIIILLVICVNKKLNISIRKLIKTILLIIILLIVVAIIFKIDFSLIIDKVQHSFNTANSTISNDNGGYIRAVQMRDLINTWKIKPLFGWGDGANAINVIRGIDGMYELTYFAMLMQRGIIGFILYFLQLLWIYVKGIKVIKYDNYLNEVMFASLIGLCTLLIANATNPYLYSFDRMIILFYPIAIINRSYVLSKIK